MEQARQRVRDLLRDLQKLLKSPVDISDVQEDILHVLKEVASDMFSSEIAILNCSVIARSKIKPSTFASWSKRQVSVSDSFFSFFFSIYDTSFV